MKVDFEIIYDGKEVKPEYHCSKCKHRLEVIVNSTSDDIDNSIPNTLGGVLFACPKCLMKTLKIEECGNWD